jgi:hypothetical protein
MMEINSKLSKRESVMNMPRNSKRSLFGLQSENSRLMLMMQQVLNTGIQTNPN